MRGIHLEADDETGGDDGDEGSAPKRPAERTEHGGEGIGDGRLRRPPDDKLLSAQPQRLELAGWR